jgi:response regulator RpfG family c-di-GMP phosphodiesterase
MSTNRILLVDDDANVLAGYERSLRKKFNVRTAQSGDRALSLIEEEGPFSVVVADMQMPGMNGVQFLRKAQDKAPDSVRLMLTGNSDQQTVADAVNHGHVFSFLTKPCAVDVLENALDNAIRQYRLVLAEKELLEQTLNGSVNLLTDMLSMVDPDGFGRAQHLRDEVKTVAAWFRSTRKWELELAGMLSQIGSVAIPPSVVAKARRREALTGAERDMLARAPEIGANLLAKIPRLQPVADIVRYQNKNFDGTGFPVDSVAGEEIPIGARILRVLSDLLAAESKNKNRLQAFQEMQRTQGKYDPKVLEAVGACYDVFVEKEQPEVQERNIRFSEMEVGHVLVHDLVTVEGTLLLKEGTRISPPVLLKLRNFSQITGIKQPILVYTKQMSAR